MRGDLLSPSHCPSEIDQGAEWRITISNSFPLATQTQHHPNQTLFTFLTTGNNATG
jgi:hypothetical protein